MGVKASGGVRDYDSAVAMIKAGATRLGTSSGAKIVQGASVQSNCVNCGLCKGVCPTGNVVIHKTDY